MHLLCVRALIFSPFAIFFVKEKISLCICLCPFCDLFVFVSVVLVTNSHRLPFQLSHLGVIHEEVSVYTCHPLACRFPSDVLNFQDKIVQSDFPCAGSLNQ